MFNRYVMLKKALTIGLTDGGLGTAGGGMRSAGSSMGRVGVS